MPIKTRMGWGIVAVVKSYEGSDPEIDFRKEFGKNYLGEEKPC